MYQWRLVEREWLAPVRQGRGTIRYFNVIAARGCCDTEAIGRVLSVDMIQRVCVRVFPRVTCLDLSFRHHGTSGVISYPESRLVAYVPYSIFEI